MNTWGYFILMGALLLLAGVMLYARFASRAREKSCHHAPGDWAAPLSVEKFGPAPADAACGTGESSSGPVLAEALPTPSLRFERPGETAPPEKARDRDYLDELQEAAAGLAMLMRSSPVKRAEPVVYAPVESAEAPAADEVVEASVTDEGEGFTGAPEVIGEFHPSLELEPSLVAKEEISEENERLKTAKEEAADEPALNEPSETEIVVSESGESEPAAPETLVEAENSSEGPTLEFAEGAETAAAAENPEPERQAIFEETPPRTLAELLGGEVVARLDRVDKTLDFLESLVVSMEEGFAALKLQELELRDAMETGEAAVAEAA